MKKRKVKTEYLSQPVWLSVLLVVAILTFTMVGTAKADPEDPNKSLYVITSINQGDVPIDAYEIDGGSMAYEETYDIVYRGWGAVGLALDNIDDVNGYVMITYEMSPIIQVLDGKRMKPVFSVTAPDATNLAGLVVDQDRSKIYTIDRSTNHLYVYSWDRDKQELKNDKEGETPPYIELTDCENGFGIALDEENDRLYVGDLTTTVKCYIPGKDNEWATVEPNQGFVKDPNYCFTVNHEATGIAVDVNNQYVYTGTCQMGSDSKLSQYKLTEPNEYLVEVNSPVLGIAVDQDTGYVFLTTYSAGDNPHQLRSYDPNLVFDSSVNLYRPTGLAIKKIGYIPQTHGDIDPAEWNYFNIWDEDLDVFLTYFMVFDDVDDNEPNDGIYEEVKSILVNIEHNPSHCRTDSGLCLDHIHYDDRDGNDLTVTYADRYWDWYYEDVPSVSRVASAGNLRESIGYALDGYADSNDTANYDYWLVHGDGPNEADKAFTEDCDEIDPRSGVLADDRIAYLDLPTSNYYDQSTIVTAIGGDPNKPEQITWKCGYSGVYSFDNSGQIDQWATPGRNWEDVYDWVDYRVWEKWYQHRHCPWLPYHWHYHWVTYEEWKKVGVSLDYDPNYWPGDSISAHLYRKK